MSTNAKTPGRAADRSAVQRGRLMYQAGHGTPDQRDEAREALRRMGADPDEGTAASDPLGAW